MSSVRSVLKVVSSINNSNVFFSKYKTCTYSRQALCADGFEIWIDWNAVYVSEVISRGKLDQRVDFWCCYNDSETSWCSKFPKVS